MANPPNRHCAKGPSYRPHTQRRGPPNSGTFTAPPRGPGATRIGGKRMKPYPLLGRGKRNFCRGGEWPRFRPVPTLEVTSAESTASEIGRPFPRLWPRKRARGAAPTCRDPPHRSTEIDGIPRHLTGPFRMGRVAKDDFIPLLYAPRRRAIGFLEMAREIGGPTCI